MSPSIRAGFGVFLLLAWLASIEPGRVPAQPVAPTLQGSGEPIVEAFQTRWNTADLPSRRAMLKPLRRPGTARRYAAVAPLLIGALEDRDPEIRAGAAMVLGGIGPSDLRAVPALTRALRDPEPKVRSAAAWGLGGIGPAASAAIPELVATLRVDRDPPAHEVVSALRAIGEPAVPALMELLNDPDSHRRLEVVEAIGALGPAAEAAIPALSARFHDPVPEVRRGLARAMAEIGPAGLDSLIRGLRDRDPRVRGTAARALADLGARAQPAIAALIDALLHADPPFDPEPPPRWSSLEESARDQPALRGYQAALRSIGAAAVPALIEPLHRPDRRTQRRVILALGFFQGQARAAVPLLVERLEDPALRLEAAEALGGIAGAARAAIPRLIEGLKDPDALFRAAAAEALGRIGKSRVGIPFGNVSSARRAVRPLIESLGDTEPRVRAAAAHALGDIATDSEIATPDLLARLRDPAAEVRLAALRALPRTGGAPTEAGDPFAALLGDADPRVRIAAMKLVRENDLISAKILVGLLAALKDPDAEVRAAAAQNLALTSGRTDIRVGARLLMEGGGKPTFGQSLSPWAALRTALADPDPRVRGGAVASLRAFQGESEDSVPLLIAVLKDSDDKVRSAAAGALGQFGSDARAAVPALFEALAQPAGNRAADLSTVSQALAFMGGDVRSRMFDRLCTRLGDRDPEVRRRAADALESLGTTVSSELLRRIVDPKTSRPAQHEMVGILARNHRIGGLRDEEYPIGMAPEARAAIPTLEALAGESDPQIGLQALEFLAVIERGDDERVRLFLQALRLDGDEAMSPYSVLGVLTPAMIPRLVANLNDPDPQIRADLIRAITELSRNLLSEPRPDEDEGPSPSDEVKEEWARSLRLKTQAAESIRPLLKDADPSVRWNAARALGLFGVEARTVVPALVRMVKTESGRLPAHAPVSSNKLVPSNYYSGEYALGENEPDGEPVRIAAIQALGEFGPEAAAAIPEFSQILRDETDPRVLWYTIGAMTGFGPRAKEAVPDLIPALRSKRVARGAPLRQWHGVVSQPQGPIRLAAAVALGSIGADARAAVPALTGALDDPEAVVRGEAAAALGQIGPAAAAAVHALVRRSVEEAADRVADMAAESLGEIGPPAVPALIPLLRVTDPDARVRIVRTLGQIGPKAASAIPDLLRALSDRDEIIRTAAAQALGEIASGTDAQAVIPGLVRAIQDEDQVVRVHAAQALGSIGKRVPAALAGLARFLTDEDPHVRRTAEDAIKVMTSGVP